MADATFKEAMNELMTAYHVYSEDMLKGIAKIQNKTASEMAKAILADSPSRPKNQGKKYRDGWTVQRAIYKNANTEVTAVIYNKTKPQLTHLLENDHHAGVDRHIVKGRPHIEPAEQQYTELFVNRVIDYIQKGGAVK